MNEKDKDNEEVTKHPNKVAGIGSSVRFQPSGSAGKGTLGVIKSLKSSGITITAQENGKEKDFLVQPAQIIRFYKDGELSP